MIEIRDGEGKIIHLDPTAKTVAEALENAVKVNGTGNDVSIKEGSRSSTGAPEDIELKGFDTWNDFLKCIHGNSIKDARVEINNGKVDVIGNVYLMGHKLTELPVQFGKVTGYFMCSHNNLKTLEGSPYKVGGAFECDGNDLRDLKSGPKEVGGYYNCSNNNLISLDGCASVVGEFNCETNQLRDLKGGPKKTWGDYKCSRNKITDLTGGPVEVHGSFYCDENQLRDLKGGPVIVEENYNCSHNKIIDLSGVPKKIGGDFTCCENKKKFTKDEVNEYIKVGGNIRT